jgi:CheY-like chemotaxis protein
MSHEIRTPMNAILGYAQLLENDVSIGEKSRKRASVIHTSGEHLLRLVNDVLELSRVETGRVTLVVEPFDIKRTLEEIQQMFLALAPIKNNQLTFSLDPGLPKAITADCGKIRQVLINLLSNALKFTNQGSIQVKVNSEQIKPGKVNVLIQVIDSGRGIEARDLSRIFKAFEQTESGVQAGGAGLGLTISRNFARLMDGDLTVKSELGKGSSFTFSFHADQVSEESLSPKQSASKQLRLDVSHLGRKVLVVDDMETNREVLADLLSRTGFDVRLAASGEEAIQMHNSWKPDLIFTDLRMPDIDGLEVIRRLRAMGSQTVLVGLTASNLSKSKEAVMDAGGNDLMFKPYRDKELLEKISSLLGVNYVAVEDKFS